jgi:hypothetical protein
MFCVEGARAGQEVCDGGGDLIDSSHVSADEKGNGWRFEATTQPLCYKRNPFSLN